MDIPQDLEFTLIAKTLDFLTGSIGKRPPYIDRWADDANTHLTRIKNGEISIQDPVWEEVVIWTAIATLITEAELTRLSQGETSGSHPRVDFAATLAYGHIKPYLYQYYDATGERVNLSSAQLGDGTLDIDDPDSPASQVRPPYVTEPTDRRGTW